MSSIQDNYISENRATALQPEEPRCVDEKDPCATGVIAAETSATNKSSKSLSFYLALLSLMLLVLIVSLDATALSVAIPTITSNLHGTSLTAFWANISFMLAVVVVQPIYTNVSDVLGRKIALYTGFILFTIGSIIFSVSQSMAVLILGRAIQGLGGGGLDVLNEIIVADITTLKERPLYLGLISIPMAVGTAVGPIMGAAFSEYTTWRWIGWVNLPIIAVSAALAFFFLQLKPIEKSIWLRLKSLDSFGLLLFTVGITAFSLPLSWGGAMYPWSSWRTIVPLAIGAVILALCAIYESRPAQAVFPYRIFRSRTAQVTLIGSFIHGLILYTLLSYMPLFFQSVLLEPPLQSAISMLPIVLLVTVSSGLAGWMVEVIRHYRWQLWGGWMLLAIGTGLISLWNTETSVSTKVGFQILTGVGMGVLFTVLSIPMQASAPSAEDQGLAVGILVSFRLFGALIGLSIGSSAFSSSFGNSISRLGSPLPPALVALNDAKNAVGFIPYLRQVQNVSHDEMYVVRNIYKDAIQIIWYIMAAFGGLGFLLSLLTESLTLETEELGRQHFDTDMA